MRPIATPLREAQLLLSQYNELTTPSNGPYAGTIAETRAATGYSRDAVAMVYAAAGKRMLISGAAAVFSGEAR
ncbi:MAG: hypothetical protein WBS15_15955 [Mycobacterium sp.]|uniref:hypothetical protein n=1 Tax=Mycobacterium sp. TaxID=1785 RepID=UPI003BB652A5